jgi:putative oxidoreductase
LCAALMVQRNVRRLHSTFAHGSAGVGLLIVRVVVGVALLAHAIIALRNGPSIEATILDILSAAAGGLLLLGLWTPVAGGLAAVYSVWCAYRQSADWWYCLMIGALGLAVALLGPGAWSVDARLFGWRRLDLEEHNNSRRPPD